jgi:hypothetical protein
MENHIRSLNLLIHRCCNGQEKEALRKKRETASNKLKEFAAAEVKYSSELHRLQIIQQNSKKLRSVER